MKITTQNYENHKVAACLAFAEVLDLSRIQSKRFSKVLNIRSAFPGEKNGGFILGHIKFTYYEKCCSYYFC